MQRIHNKFALAPESYRYFQTRPGLRPDVFKCLDCNNIFMCNHTDIRPNPKYQGKIILDKIRSKPNPVRWNALPTICYYCNKGLY